MFRLNQEPFTNESTARTGQNQVTLEDLKSLINRFYHGGLPTSNAVYEPVDEVDEPDVSDSEIDWQGASPSTHAGTSLHVSESRDSDSSRADVIREAESFAKEFKSEFRNPFSVSLNFGGLFVRAMHNSNTFQAHHQLGCKCIQSKDFERAKVHFMEALQACESLQESLNDFDADRIELFEVQRESYCGLQRALLALDLVAEAFVISERGKARALDHRLKVLRRPRKPLPKFSDFSPCIGGLPKPLYAQSRDPVEEVQMPFQDDSDCDEVWAPVHPLTHSSTKPLSEQLQDPAEEVYMSFKDDSDCDEVCAGAQHPMHSSTKPLSEQSQDPADEVFMSFKDDSDCDEVCAGAQHPMHSSTKPLSEQSQDPAEEVYMTFKDDSDCDEARVAMPSSTTGTNKPLSEQSQDPANEPHTALRDDSDCDEVCAPAGAQHPMHSSSSNFLGGHSTSTQKALSSLQDYQAFLVQEGAFLIEYSLLDQFVLIVWLFSPRGDLLCCKTIDLQVQLLPGCTLATFLDLARCVVGAHGRDDLLRDAYCGAGTYGSNIQNHLNRGTVQSASGDTEGRCRADVADLTTEQGGNPGEHQVSSTASDPAVNEVLLRHALAFAEREALLRDLVLSKAEGAPPPLQSQLPDHTFQSEFKALLEQHEAITAWMSELHSPSSQVGDVRHHLVLVEAREKFICAFVAEQSEEIAATQVPILDERGKLDEGARALTLGAAAAVGSKSQHSSAEAAKQALLLACTAILQRTAGWKDLQGLTDAMLASDCCVCSPAVRAYLLSCTESLFDQGNMLRSLHALLIAPVMVELVPGVELLVVPHRELFTVPWAALLAPDGRHLVESHPIRVAPSLAVIQRASRQRNSGEGGINEGCGGSSVEPRMVVIGNPYPLAAPGFIELPNAQQEALSVYTQLKAAGCALSTSCVCLMRERATKAAVLAAMKKADWAHLACHGSLELRALVFAAEPATKDDGVLSMDGVRVLRLARGSTVVLSACNTARGEVKGEGVIGISRELLACGAAATVVSLWSVPDESTQRLMEAMYFGLTLGYCVPQALRFAMLAVLRCRRNSQCGSVSKVLAWAGFIVVGARTMLPKVNPPQGTGSSSGGSLKADASVEEVSLLLERVGLNPALARENDLTGDLLLSMTDNDLANEFDLSQDDIRRLRMEMASRVESGPEFAVNSAATHAGAGNAAKTCKQGETVQTSDGERLNIAIDEFIATNHAWRSAVLRLC